MFNPIDIIDVLAQNIKKTKNPFAMDKTKANTWYISEEIKQEGECLLFTGLMYQMIPYIEVVSSHLEKYENSKISNYTYLAKFLPSFVSKIGLETLISKDERDNINEILKNICKALKKSEVDFFYREDLDLYSGILLYDLGDEDNFKKHAMFVASKLKQNNISKIITIDPHTTYALKVLYPKYTGEYFEVKTYFELLNLEANYSKKVLLHDPCFYGRYLKLSHVPRKLLSSLGVEIIDIQKNESFTHCCGGPAESLCPSLAKKIREKRSSQLKQKGQTIITMCPICYANLRKTTSNIEDLANLIGEIIS